MIRNMIVYLLCSLIAMSGCTAASSQSAMANSRLFDKSVTLENSKSRILVAGHRGYSSEYPENTLLSFEKAAELGVDMVETDVRLTSDGVPVLMHDKTVTRTTGSAGTVSAMTLEEIKALDAGSWKDQKFEGEKIPTLEELVISMQKYPGMLYNIEAKQAAPEVVDKIVSIMNTYHLEGKYVILCTDADVLKYAYDTYHVLCAALQEESMTGFDSDPTTGTYSYCYSVTITSDYISAERFESFKNKGIEIWSSTPNTEKAVNAHLKYGSRLLCCSNPVPALRILQKANER